jgi:hypothetical protein
VQDLRVGRFLSYLILFDAGISPETKTWLQVLRKIEQEEGGKNKIRGLRLTPDGLWPQHPQEGGRGGGAKHSNTG